MAARLKLRCIAHDLHLAQIALSEAAAFGADLELWSPAEGSGTLGVGFWAALDRAVRRPLPSAQAVTVLHCSDAAGHVLAAFREGLEQVHFTGSDAAAQKLHRIADASGAILHPGPPPDLDLCDRLDPAASCRHALRGLGASIPPISG